MGKSPSRQPVVQQETQVTSLPALSPHSTFSCPPSPFDETSLGVQISPGVSPGMQHARCSNVNDDDRAAPWVAPFPDWSATLPRRGTVIFLTHTARRANPMATLSWKTKSKLLI